MPGPWDASSERKLLLCIIGLQSKLKWNVIAQRMGEKFTEEACRQKYYKLKKESDKLAGTTSASTTQVKVEATTDTASARPASGRGRKRKNEEEEPSGSLKRMRKAPPASGQDKSQGPLGPIKLEKGAVSWASDDETPAPLQSAHAQAIE